MPLEPPPHPCLRTLPPAHRKEEREKGGEEEEEEEEEGLFKANAVN